MRTTTCLGKSAAYSVSLADKVPLSMAGTANYFQPMNRAMGALEESRADLSRHSWMNLAPRFRRCYHSKKNFPLPCLTIHQTLAQYALFTHECGCWSRGKKTAFVSCAFRRSHVIAHTDGSAIILALGIRGFRWLQNQCRVGRKVRRITSRSVLPSRDEDHCRCTGRSPSARIESIQKGTNSVTGRSNCNEKTGGGD